MSRRQSARKRQIQEDPLAIDGESYEQAVLIESGDSSDSGQEGTCTFVDTSALFPTPPQPPVAATSKASSRRESETRSPKPKKSRKTVETQHQKEFAKKVNESASEREKRLVADRKRQLKRRKTETPEQRERRLESQRERQNRFRQRENEKQYQKRLEDQRNRQAAKRQKENTEERKTRKESTRQARVTKRENETPAEREQRLINQRRRQANRLANETPEQHKRRITEQRIRQSYLRVKKITKKLQRLSKRLFKKVKYLRQKCADYKMTWSRDTTLLLISLYKIEPILYDPSHEKYEDQEARKEAYLRLFKVLQNKKEELTITAVKRRIKSLRSEYLREKWNYNRVVASGDSRIYTPKFWLFDQLRFLDNYPSFPLSPTPASRGGENNAGSSSENATTAAESKKFRRKKRRQAEQETQELIRACTNLLATPTVDEYEALGINVQAKLRKMQQNQQVYAEKIINKVITLGMLGKLQEQTDLNNYSQMIPLSDTL